MCIREKQISSLMRTGKNKYPVTGKLGALLVLLLASTLFAEAGAETEYLTF